MIFMALKEETKEDMLRIYDAYSQQCEIASELGRNIKIETPINAVVICGVGGSAIAGDIITSYLNISLPSIVNNTYDLPGFVNRNTLVFLVSYSGDTEEVLSCFKAARTKGAKVVGISSGGKLHDLCLQSKMPFIKVPGGLQPRDATALLTLPLLNVLQSSRVIKMSDKEYPELFNSLKKDIKLGAQDIAKKMKNKIPVIYTSKRMNVLAKTWKKKLNETAKTMAIINEFPELNHNEIIAFEDPLADYFVVIIQDDEDHPRIKRRMELTKEMLQQKDCSVMMLKIKGDNLLSKIFSGIMLGSYVSYYLAEEYNINPIPIEMVEEFKKRMGKWQV